LYDKFATYITLVFVCGFRQKPSISAMISGQILRNANVSGLIQAFSTILI